MSPASAIRDAAEAGWAARADALAEYRAANERAEVAWREATTRAAAGGDWAARHPAARRALTRARAEASRAFLTAAGGGQ